MKTRAAGKPLEGMNLDLQCPMAGETLVRIKAAGICQIAHNRGQTNERFRPLLAGPSVLSTVAI